MPYDVDAIAGEVNKGFQITQRVFAVTMEIFSLLLRPLALLTQIFVRKDFGERYFTTGAMLTAVCLVIVAGQLTSQVEPLYTTLWIYIKLTDVRPAKFPLFFTGAFYWMPFVWPGLIGGAFGLNMARLTRRYAKGEKWHSRCSGVPIVPFSGKLLQYTVVALAVLALDLAGCCWMALLALMSIGASGALDREEARRLREAVMDSIDAQIESEVLGKAIEQRLSPQQASGLMARVPKRFDKLISLKDKNLVEIKSSGPASARSGISEAETTLAR